jgi:hypothetical protein
LSFIVQEPSGIIGEIAIGEPPQVSQHLSLGAVVAEHRMGHKLGFAPERLRQRIAHLRGNDLKARIFASRCTCRGAERDPHPFDNLGRGGFVYTDADPARQPAQIESELLRPRYNRIALLTDFDDNRIEKRLVKIGQPRSARPRASTAARCETLDAIFRNPSGP